jgi:glycosyltransferase involved in cell wall biosynthesis
MTLTVLVCVHSTNDFYDNLLIESLKSLERQTYKNFETVIVLDECWVHTKIKIENEIKLYCKILIREKKEGLSFAKNFGLSHINSDLVAFLDADDLYVEDKIEKQINFFRYNKVDFLGTHAFNRYVDRQHFFDSCFKINEYITNQQIKSVIEYQNVLTHGSMMIKKKALDDLNGYNNVKGAEDWDLWRRASNKEFIFFQLPERLYVYTLGTSVAR